MKALHTYMKEPMDVVFGYYKQPSAIQWPNSESIVGASQGDQANILSSTYERGHRNTEEIKAAKAVPLRLRQGRDDKCVCLESSLVPNMFAKVVRDVVPSGISGIMDTRRIVMVDMSEEMVENVRCYVGDV